VAGRYRIVDLLRSIEIPETQIHAALCTELGLTAAEADEALLPHADANAPAPACR
jgi:hypothetical protein